MTETADLVCFKPTSLFLCCAFSTEVPHFRYTDGTTYLKEASSPERTGKYVYRLFIVRLYRLCSS